MQQPHGVAPTETKAGLSDEEWRELSQDLPTKEDAIIKKYMEGREALITQEKKQRSDYSFRQALSPIAQKACEIVARIRKEEQEQIWTPKLEEQIAAREDVVIYPGMIFTHAKDIMESTKLWRIVRRMPKGALLHSHCDAMVEFDYLFDVLLATAGMHMVAPDGALSTLAALSESRVAFRFLKTPRTGGPSVWSDAYAAGTPVHLADAADAFPGTGRAGFVAWLKSRCTLSTADAEQSHHGVSHIWSKFYACFDVIGATIHYEPIWRAFLRRLMAQLHADGLAWAEVRFAWPLNYCREGEEVPESDYSHMFRCLDEELDAFKAANPSFWGLRMIWTAPRRLDTRPLVENMDQAITTKMEWPHLLAGFDLVGQEDLGRPLADAVPELMWFRRQCAAEGVEMPFFFHAGECLGDGDATDSK